MASQRYRRSHLTGLSVLMSVLVSLVLLDIGATRGSQTVDRLIRLAHQTTAASDVSFAAKSLTIYDVTSAAPADLHLVVTSRSVVSDEVAIVASPGNILQITFVHGAFCVRGNDVDGMTVYYDSGVGHLTNDPVGSMCGV